MAQKRWWDMGCGGYRKERTLKEIMRIEVQMQRVMNGKI